MAISFLTSKSGDSDDGCVARHVELESPPSVETEVNKEYGVMMGNHDAMSVVTEQSHEVSYKDWRSKISSGRNGKVRVYSHHGR